MSAVAETEAIASGMGPATWWKLPRTYGVWLGGSLVSQLGDAALYFALGWSASAVGGSAAGLVLSAIVLPRTVLLLVGGVVRDRAGARRVMIAGDAVMLVVAATLGVVAYRWGTPLPLLVVAGLVIGTVIEILRRPTAAGGGKVSDTETRPGGSRVDTSRCSAQPRLRLPRCSRGWPCVHHGPASVNDGRKLVSYRRLKSGQSRVASSVCVGR